MAQEYVSLDEITSSKVTFSAIFFSILICFVYGLYRLALPKPYKGIPHNEHSAKRFAGDLPEVFALAKAGRRSREFWADLCEKKNSPIVQFFPAPFFKPIIVVSDFCEVQDILTKRSKEIDRSFFSTIMFSGIAQEHFICMGSKHPKYASSKYLVRDITGQTYIQSVTIPSAYNNILNLIETWKFKARLTASRPFEAFDDIKCLTADSIFETAFDFKHDEKYLVRNLNRLKREKLSVNPSSGQESIVQLPEYPADGLLDTIDVIARATGKFTETPVIQLHWPIYNRLPRIRRVRATIKRILSAKIDEVAKKWETEGPPQPFTNALHYMVSRERQVAEKSGRAPNFHSGQLYDGIYGYCFGGQDTSQGLLSFLIKYFGAYQDVQLMLRTALQEEYKTAWAEGRNPTADEIHKTQVPYLNAFIEEVIRLNSVGSAVMKEATEDMIILGHHVPKNAQLLFPLYGPSIDRPALPVDNSIRSKTAQESADTIRTNWDRSEWPVSEFHPVRWLHRNEEGKLEFDPRAGPQLTFSKGPRECWGKKLAYAQIKTFTALMVWNFNFLPLPKELENWDIVDVLNARPKVCLVRLRARN